MNAALEGTIAWYVQTLPDPYNKIKLQTAQRQISKNVRSARRPEIIAIIVIVPITLDCSHTGEVSCKSATQSENYGKSSAQNP